MSERSSGSFCTVPLARARGRSNRGDVRCGIRVGIALRAGLGEPRAWLFGIARNILGRSVKRGRVENEARARLGMPALVLDDDAFDRIEALASQNGAALEALEELSERVREAVSGRVIEEREYSELASALACSESVARQRVKRGLARMRDRLEVNQ